MISGAIHAAVPMRVCDRTDESALTLDRPKSQIFTSQLLNRRRLSDLRSRCRTPCGGGGQW